MKNDKENPPSETTIVRAKDLMELMRVGERTAFRRLKEIKEHYRLKTVLYCHVKKHFHIL